MNAEPGRIYKISVHALGGQGGGVLSDWIRSAAEASGLYCQTTSVPGVAQRTGTTVYYVELGAPSPSGQAPIMALMPFPGDVDVVIAAELMEAGRAVARGLVTPDRTTLIASAHRVFAISEKTEMGDGAMSAAKVIAGCEASARHLVMADLNRLAEQNGSVISAALLGALAGSGALPLTRAAFEAAITAGGIGVATSLKAFGAAFDAAAAGAPYVAVPAPKPVAPDTTASLEARIAGDLPEPVQVTAGIGVSRLIDYQGRAYAELYLKRLGEIIAAERQLGGDAHGWPLTTEAARHLALWMSYEDVIRVADLKTRDTRFRRVRAEVRAGEAQIVQVSEFMHPRFEEMCDVLPNRLGARLKNSGRARRWLGPFFRSGRRVSTSRLSGFLLLYIIARLRRFRPGNHRHAEETQRIEAWLASAMNAARVNYDLGVEVIRLQRVVKGYGETHERGLRSFAAIIETVAGMMERPDAASVTRGLIEAALKDDSGARLVREIRALEMKAAA